VVIFDRKMGSRVRTLRGLDDDGSRPPVLLIIRNPYPEMATADSAAHHFPQRRLGCTPVTGNSNVPVP
jgi:hypothetical protein